MDAPLQHLTGAGHIYLADGSVAHGRRRYAISLVPWYEPARPLAISSWVELYDEEPLHLENQLLALHLSDGRWLAFRLVDVSESPPYRHTFMAESWPSDQRLDGMIADTRGEEEERAPE